MQKPNEPVRLSLGYDTVYDDLKPTMTSMTHRVTVFTSLVPRLFKMAEKKSLDPTVYA